ncbi:hypothetical protein JCGZ_20619 [Jatropha curcas]|uniref:KIB1-4 beta-propeller domain-containing protein n=1 Tax=Jatropha curcas TaxID=180498 RepID=A0A067JRL1_JATCU|nr:hypothetical protein JCGZ_20619 [Jatropha curcas]
MILFLLAQSVRHGDPLRSTKISTDLLKFLGYYFEQTVVALYCSTIQNGNFINLIYLKPIQVLQRKRDFSHTEAFEVFKLNFENGKCEEVERLDNKALFLGQNSSLCVDVKRRSFRTGYMANRIYFIDTEAASRYRVGREKNLGIYNMQTGRIERSFANNCAYLSPLMWIELLP